MVIGANLRRKNKYNKDSSQEKKKAIVRENHCRLPVQTIIKAQSGTARCELRTAHAQRLCNYCVTPQVRGGQPHALGGNGGWMWQCETLR